MSTKIYNGYIYNGPLEELNNDINLVRPRIISLSLKHIIASKSQYCVDIMDRLIVDTLPDWVDEKSSIGTNVSLKFQKEAKEIKNSGLRNSEFDYGCELSLLPYKRKVLIIAYYEKDFYIKALKNRIKLLDFSYYDNSDRPETISSSEWRSRKNTWEKALGGWGNPPSVNGLSKIIHSGEIPFFDLLSADRVIRRVCSTKLRDRAIDLASEKWITGKSGGKLSWEKYVEFSRELKKNPEAKKERDGILRNIHNKIRNFNNGRIAPDHLRTNINDLKTRIRKVYSFFYRI